MRNDDLEARILARGKEFFDSIRGEKPALFNTKSWMGKAMDWSMRNEPFKVQLFRFVDVFPSLTTGKQVTEHIREYFGEGQIPGFLAAGAKVAGRLGPAGGAVLNRILTANIQAMARQFIIAEDTREAVKKWKKLHRDGFAAVLDVLGEATLSAEEANAYVDTYLDLLAALDLKVRHLPGLPGRRGDPDLDWGHAPKINISVKPSALYALANPRDFEGSVTAILEQLRRIFARVVQLNGFLCIDMEAYRYKDITLEVFRRLKLEYRDYPHLGVVLQSYLKDTDRDLEALLAWARQNRLQISIRLVKGAYWDYETVVARQSGWQVPVWTIKAQTDAAFERQARKILENHQICHFACGSHNIRSIAAALETAAALQVPDERYEFQVLYGMAEPVRQGLLKVAGRLRLYCPYGDMVPGMGYLVRRLLENTANESFLRQSFAEEVQIEKLLRNPAPAAEHALAALANSRQEHQETGDFPPFRNEPMVDFTRAEHRAAFPEQIARIRRQSGERFPLYINGKKVWTADCLDSLNPGQPSEVIGSVCQAGIAEVEEAVTAARAAFPAWRDTAPQVRAGLLVKAATVARRRAFELAAWQVLEIGKQWEQAYADVAEAIDFLEYYAREMVRLAPPQRLGSAPGEKNLYFYEPRGVAAVIAPWNFPLAISTGMVSAALVTGNCVVFKPSGLTPVVGYQLSEILREAGVPAGVFNYLPGRGSVIGDYLVDHPQVTLIAFTGSMEVGLRIIERAARVHPGQAQVKRVVCEMGGKNAIVIDDNADLDEAVPHVLFSAFGFQGQKCSACSRVIVLDAIYDRFVERLTAMARVTKVGLAEDPAYYMGAVADKMARQKILNYIEVGKREGKLLYQGPVPQGEGYYVPMTIIGGIEPAHRLAQEEIFGPVLALMRVKDFDEAIAWANSTPFALTGGVFSRSPRNLGRASREFRVGNLYLNRNITGALVERQPFGGSGMSGIGTKAGGPDYLLHFMDPRVVTENTMRRGFAPDEEVDRREFTT